MLFGWQHDAITPDWRGFHALQRIVTTGSRREKGRVAPAFLQTQMSERSVQASLHLTDGLREQSLLRRGISLGSNDLFGSSDCQIDSGGANGADRIGFRLADLLFRKSVATSDEILRLLTGFFRQSGSFAF